jgi:hypothetical protein
MFAFQIGAILLLSERRPLPVSPATFRTAVLLAADPWSIEQLTQLLTLSDPAAFALPGPHGFSREGWLAFSRPEFRLTDWTEPPQWLKPEASELGAGLHQFILSNTMPPLLIADKPLPRVSRDELSAGAVPTPTTSELQVEGELAAWALINRVELPSWPSAELLTNTVIQTLIDAACHNVATVVLAGSGSVDADKFGLQTTKAARFRPPRQFGGTSYTSPKGTTAGKLIFKWHTVPPTNIAPATATLAP